MKQMFKVLEKHKKVKINTVNINIPDIIKF